LSYLSTHFSFSQSLKSQQLVSVSVFAEHFLHKSGTHVRQSCFVYNKKKLKTTVKISEIYHLVYVYNLIYGDKEIRNIM